MAGKSSKGEIDAEFFSNVGKEVLNLVESALLADATDHNNVLSVKQVQDVIGALANAPDLMANILKKLARPNLKIKYKRDPFTRILVERFSDLFPTQGGYDLEQGALSRRMLPGFFVAIRFMLGGPIYDKFRLECSELFDALREEKPTMSEPAHWGAFYGHPDANRICQLVYVRVALYFATYAKRKAWFIRMINSKLKSINPLSASDQEKEWVFTSGHFVRLFTALYLDNETTGKLKSVYSEIISKEFDSHALKKVHTMREALVKDSAG